MHAHKLEIQPWVSQPAAGPSSGPGSFESTYRAVMGFNDEPSDDDGEQGKVKVRIFLAITINLT
jgi:hypothetical protein